MFSRKYFGYENIKFTLTQKTKRKYTLFFLYWKSFGNLQEESLKIEMLLL